MRIKSYTEFINEAKGYTLDKNSPFYKYAKKYSNTGVYSIDHPNGKIFISTTDTNSTGNINVRLSRDNSMIVDKLTQLGVIFSGNQSGELSDLSGAKWSFQRSGFITLSNNELDNLKLGTISNILKDPSYKIDPKIVSVSTKSIDATVPNPDNSNTSYADTFFGKSFMKQFRQYVEKTTGSPYSASTSIPSFLNKSELQDKIKNDQELVSWFKKANELQSSRKIVDIKTGKTESGTIDSEFVELNNKIQKRLETIQNSIK